MTNDKFTTALDLSMKLYTAGATEFLNLLTAEHNLYTSEDALVQSDRTIDADLIALYKALGGGWYPAWPQQAQTEPRAQASGYLTVSPSATASRDSEFSIHEPQRAQNLDYPLAQKV